MSSESRRESSQPVALHLHPSFKSHTDAHQQNDCIVNLIHIKVLLKVVILFKVAMVMVFTWTRISAWQRASSPGTKLPPRSLQLGGGTTLY